MVREDIVRGLKNAIDRGEPIEKAVKSFISAGYNSVEVEQAAQSIINGATAITSGDSYGEMKKKGNLPTVPARNIRQQQIPVPPETQMQGAAQANKSPAFRRLNEIQPGRISPIAYRKKKNIILIIVLVFILLLLIGGLIYMIFYGQEFLNRILEG